jgi:hypothetical protein
MKRNLLLTTLLLCSLTSSAFAVGEDFKNTRPVQPKGFGEGAKPGIQAGGDNFGDATVIPGLPYTDGGNTCTYINDYVPPCVPSSAPDVVYSFTPTTDMCVNVSLCGSNYDTELVIYENNPATPVACQDDSPQCGLQSNLENVSLIAGNTYYILIDGFADACGEYVLNVEACPPPPVCEPCPPLAVQEGEPTCSDGYVDVYNAGCNSSPPTVTTLACEPSVTVCGTYGVFDGGGTRDTDWYEVTVSEATTITATVTGHGLSGSALAIVDNACPPAVLCGDFNLDDECGQKTCEAAVGPGTYRIFVASFFDGTPCGSTYVLNLSGLTCPPVPANSTSWGAVKAIYR